MADNEAAARTMGKNQDIDPDLKRAQDLVELHAVVKLAYEHGTDRELHDARDAVMNILKDL